MYWYVSFQLVNFAYVDEIKKFNNYPKLFVMPIADGTQLQKGDQQENHPKRYFW